MTTWLKESQDWCKAGFRPGEAQLIVMGKQLKSIPLYKEDNHSYLADEIIKLYGPENIEVLLLETSGCFGSNDKPKISFDHHKGLFGALAMLKSIADEFPMATVGTFQRCKVFFLCMVQVRYKVHLSIALSLTSCNSFRRKRLSLEPTIRAKRPNV